jgi:V-type H+-transporting ATPase subunit F
MDDSDASDTHETRLLNCAVILSLYGWQDTVTGFLLAGVGHRNAAGSNFLIVKQDTQLPQIEDAFRTLSQRDDVGIILINQHVANGIRHVLKDYNATIPTVLEIPSKEHPYDPEQDYIMQRVNMFLGYVRVMSCMRSVCTTSGQSRRMFLIFVFLVRFLVLFLVGVVYKKNLRLEALQIVFHTV